MVVLILSNLGLVLLLLVMFYIAYSYNKAYLKVYMDRALLLKKMQINSMAEAEDYNPNDIYDRDISIYDDDEVIELNSSAQIGDKATIECNVNFKDVIYSLDVPVFLTEKSVDNKRLRFEIDVAKINPDLSPYNNPEFLDKISLAIQKWMDVDTHGITWRNGDGGYLELTEHEAHDIVKFLQFTHIPEDKQEKIKRILNI